MGKYKVPFAQCILWHDRIGYNTTAYDKARKKTETLSLGEIVSTSCDKILYGAIVLNLKTFCGMGYIDSVKFVTVCIRDNSLIHFKGSILLIVAPLTYTTKSSK